MSTAPKDEPSTSFGDAARLGFEIVEAAERVLVADRCCPGSQATWYFEMDGTAFKVVVTVASALTVAPTRPAEDA